MHSLMPSFLVVILYRAVTYSFIPGNGVYNVCVLERSTCKNIFWGELWQKISVKQLTWGSGVVLFKMFFSKSGVQSALLIYAGGEQHSLSDRWSCFTPRFHRLNRAFTYQGGWKKMAWCARAYILKKRTSKN